MSPHSVTAQRRTLERGTTQPKSADRIPGGRTQRTPVGRIKRIPGGRVTGVTLVEMLTVVAMIAILSTVAVASYRNYVMRTNRTEGTAALLRVQLAEEKFFLQYRTYTADLVQPPPVGLGFGSATTQSGYYVLGVAPDANSTNNIATSFLVTATAAGGQADDKSCATFTINDRGQRQSSPSLACWR